MSQPYNVRSLTMSQPHNKDVEKKVYTVIKWGIDSLEYPDVELFSKQRSKHVNKKRGDIQSCFLYCSLYPVAIRTDDLIRCWWAEGILGEHDSYEEAYNRGVTTIESLKDVCLLETHKKDSVKMHDVVRDVAIWIDNSFGNEQNSVIQAGIGLTKISHAKVSASVKRISFVGNKIEHLPDCFTKCPETTSLLLQDNEPLVEIPREFFLSFPALTVLNLSETNIRALPPSINSLCQLRALILQSCKMLKELRCLPQGMDKLTNLRLLNLPAANLKESIVQGFFLELSSIEMLIMLDSERGIWNLQDDIRKRALLGPNFDEISSLHNLTSLFIPLDSSAIFDKDYTWMTRLKRFYIDVGDTVFTMNNKSARTICISNCEIFSNGELFGMLQFASDLSLYKCMGLRKLIVNQKSFNGLKKLDICFCSCDFRLVEEGSGKIDPLPNLEHLILTRVDNLKSVSDFGQFLGLRFSKLHQLYLHSCASLTCLFNIGEAFSAPKNLEEITILKLTKYLTIQSGIRRRAIGQQFGDVAGAFVGCHFGDKITTEIESYLGSRLLRILTTSSSSGIGVPAIASSSETFLISPYRLCSVSHACFEVEVLAIAEVIIGSTDAIKALRINWSWRNQSLYLGLGTSWLLRVIVFYGAVKVP
ncbi:hypothetical protein BC332_20618 [Capsicum chinense]|nr:hypothetical protein BC332_20618 [Capsicum chinense]